MASSDSDNESECFESAEESFDENEETKNENTNLKKSIEIVDKEALKPVVFDDNTVESARAIEGESSGGSLTYRKRPERLKRVPSKTQTKPIPKSPTTELIFKTDKIVPDVFLQDITSNLSKNLNKSLSTLQQKSSNVKDMILNSLPVSSVSDSEGFSYDDKITLFSDENESLNEENHPNSCPPVNLDERIPTKSNENQKNIFEDEISESVSDATIVNRVSDIDNERNVEDSENDNQEKNVFKNTLTYDKVLNESLDLDNENLKKSDSSCLELDTVNVPAENIGTEIENSASCKETDTVKNINDICSTHENFEIIPKEEIHVTDISKIESHHSAEKTGEETAVNKKSIFTESEVSIKEKQEESCMSQEHLGDTEKNNSQNNLGLINSDKNDFINDVKKNNEIDTECNLEELKMALKNIVNEESKSPKEMDKSTEVNQGSGDGWDDFDFSDHEVESSDMIKGVQTQEPEKVETNDEMEKVKSPAVDVKSVSDKKSIKAVKPKNLVSEQKSSEKVSKSTVNKANLTEKNNIKNESHKESEKGKNITESKFDENDSWDWDNWDETPDNKETTVTSENKKAEDNTLDVSKWSGWDTFGQKPQEKQDNWGLGSWGVDVLLNKATAVTQGISSVLEAGLGAPDPETLARMEKLERENFSEQLKEVDNSENPSSTEVSKKNSLTNVNIFPVSGITSLVAGVTSKIVEHSKIQEIGSKVITGGLETLETFGKKTMEVLQEGDPGLKNKRALLLGNSKPVLSQVLKEAREKADKESKKVEEKELARKCHFETLFDDFQGMVHLEALEMLSKQCELKLDQIRSGMNSEEQEDLNGILEEVEQLCSLDEYETEMKSSVLDFKTSLQMAVEPLKNEISVHNIIQIHEDVCKWLQMSSETEPSFIEINQKLVATLAELTAATVHQFHKSGELLSVKECRKTVEEVDALSRLTNVLCKEINKLGEKFIKLSSDRVSKNDDNFNSFNEKVNTVMKNSVFYIKQAFDLLIPVLQLGAAV